MRSIGVILLTAFFLLAIFLRKKGTAAGENSAAAVPTSPTATPGIVGVTKPPSVKSQQSTEQQIASVLLPPVIDAITAPAIEAVTAPVVSAIAAPIVSQTAPLALSAAPVVAETTAPAIIAPVSQVVSEAAPEIAAAPEAVAAGSILLPALVGGAVLAVGVATSIEVINDLTGDPSQGFKDTHGGLDYNAYYEANPEKKTETFSGNMSGQVPAIPYSDAGQVISSVKVQPVADR